MALLFKDEEAARKIFERWRDRFGRVDTRDDIYVAIVRGISPQNPAHYRVLITSRLHPEQESQGSQLMIAARMNTMEPNSDINLARFLDAYARAKSYALLPAIWKGSGEPNL